MLDKEAIQQIEMILARGNDVEIRIVKSTGKLILMEVAKWKRFVSEEKEE